MKFLLINLKFILGRKFKKDTKPIIFPPADENHTTVFKYFIDAVEENSEIYVSIEHFEEYGIHIFQK